MLGLPPEAWAAVILSLRVAGVATLAGLPLAWGVALALARGRFPGRGALNVAVHLPLVLPPVVTGYALLIAFGRAGPVGRLLDDWFGITLAFQWTGAALAAGVMAFPLMVRAMRLGIEVVDPKLEEMGATFGLSRVAILTRITLPLAAPSILAAAVLGFAKAMGEFGATITFAASIPGRTQTVPSLIYALLQTPDGDAVVIRLALVSLAIAVAALGASEWLARRMVRE